MAAARLDSGEMKVITEFQPENSLPSLLGTGQSVSKLVNVSPWNQLFFVGFTLTLKDTKAVSDWLVAVSD